MSTATLWLLRCYVETDHEPEAENEPFCDNACSRSGWRQEAPSRTND